jgi:3-oxoacyl-[acyl-carrier protein] reductase
VIAMDLTGMVALVTGASAGIGRGVAEVFARCGADLVLVARRADELEVTAALVLDRLGEPVRVATIPADLAEDGAAEAVAAAAIERFGRVDIMVHSAGGSRPLPGEPGDPAAEAIWTESFAINFTAGRRLAEALLPGMRSHKHGRIITITGSSEGANLNAASPAKAAVHAWAKALSRKVGPDAVTVNSIAPGRITSEQIDRKLHPDPVERQRFIDANVPLGYFGDPVDVGNLVAFLASPLGRYITGEVIHVDGGMRRYAF